MNVVICAIAKNENKYINDGARYYFDMGFDHIYLYDNNMSKDPYVGECFDDDIKDKITIFNVQNICGNDIQVRAYNNFYKKYNETFDGCFYCDIDEFLDLNNEFNSIKEFLSQDKFNDFDQIRVRGRLFGDDDVLERDESIPVYKFFKKPVLNKMGYSCQGKAFIRGHLTDVHVYIHCVLHDSYGHHNQAFRSCLPSGKEYAGKYYNSLEDKNNVGEYEGETIFLNHYRTKTLKEFLEQKYARTQCCTPATFEIIDMTYFFALNESTPEKQEYIKKGLNKKIEERRK